MESIAELAAAQADLLEKLIKAERNFRKTPKDRIKKQLLETRIEIIEDLWKEFKEGNKEITSKATKQQKEKEDYFSKDVYDQFQEMYVVYKSAMKEACQQCISSPEEQTRTVAAKSESCEIMLPRIQLPSFSGKYCEWQTFYDMFVSLVHKNVNLAPVQKLHYLKSSLTGEPEVLIRNFSTTEANYTEAWAQLVKRYNNKKYNCHSIMQILFSQKTLQIESAIALKLLLDTTSSCLKSLNNIGVCTKSWDAIIVYLVVSKLDQESHKQWEYKISLMGDEIPTWAQLMDFLESRFRGLEMIEGSRTVYKASSQTTKQAVKTKSFHSSVQEEKKPNNMVCPCCNGPHHICHCKQFGNKSVQERYDLVQDKRLCFNCLGSAHSIKNCRQSMNCRKCGRRHHSLLHFTREEKGPATTNTTTTTSDTDRNHQGPPKNAAPTSSDTHIVANFSKNEHIQSYNVLLATAVIKAQSRNGSKYIIRALLDQGSQASFVTEATVQLLGLKREPINGWVSGLGNGQTKIKHMVTLRVESSHDPNNYIQVNAYVLSTLTSLLPTNTITSPKWMALNDIPLADPTFTSPGKIDILLGAEVYTDILLNGVMKHPQGKLLAQNTILGWIISGRVSQETSSANVITLHVQARIDNLLQQFWEIENEPPSIKRKITNDEQKCEDLYESTTVRSTDGRYVVKLPFSTEDPECQYGKHREIAIKRLNYLETKLVKKPELYAEYRTVLEEYKTLDHMQPVVQNDIDNTNAVYLPHHAVIRNDKLTTKVRVVFDGSCKGVNNVSLNDNLLVGPKLQQDLRHLLMRWRNHKICIIADLVKMYRQVRVAKEDINYQRILWRSFPDQPLEHYNLLTLTFGTACAPYLAVKTIQRLADDEQGKYPVAAEITKRDYYIDDLMTGCHTESEAVQIYEEMNNLMNSGGFELQKWSSNNEKLMQYVGKDKHQPSESMPIEPDRMVKVLGISWNKTTDNFEYSINLPEVTRKFTKRQVLSDIARLYDPLGWIAPVVVVAKLFIQTLWKSGLEWDEELTAELSNEWMKYRDELNQIKKISIPRWLYVAPGCKIELHAFSDASRSAFAANVYLRVIDENNCVTVNLVTAKTKVAPIAKEMSIPRLELSGAALAAKLLSEVSEVLGIPRENTYGWTDSTVVLAWLKGPACRWTTFVSNRVSEILTIIDYEQWGHVTTQTNPADCASRGLKPVDLAEHSLWWHGPAWLKELSIKKELTELTDTHEEEKVKSLCSLHHLNEEPLWNKFSSLVRMLKVLSYCRRILNLKVPRSDRKNLETFITTEEMKQMLQKCIGEVQKYEFEDDVKSVRTRGCVPKKSVLHALCPILDQDGILRVGGRIDLCEASYDKRHPIIVPSKNHLTKLLIADAHIKTMHGGPQLMLNHLRSQYWILRARELVKKHYRECVTCIRQAKANKTPFMGQIPAARLKPSKPFKSSGVDYAGPINIRFLPGRGAKAYKGYICLFVCMVTHAIHLEAVSDLTAKGFVAAFKRMTSRRGHCQDLYSDNGTNFTGGDKLLRDMFNNALSGIPNEIAQLLTLESTTWHFIPPQAPNFGGLWEAGVRSVKTHLRKVIGESTLTYEELSTVLAQVEACVNSRPLTNFSDNINDPLPLTPGHFLVGEPLLNVADEQCSNTVNLLDRWRLTTKMVNDFWNRWSSEYLVTLNNRYKWTTQQTEPKIDDIVIIKEQNLPPAKWLLGKIVETHPGKDKIVRVVTIQTKNGLCKRPCSKLCFLPRKSCDECQVSAQPLAT